jgi:periplasmic mercuric ion binding protein
MNRILSALGLGAVLLTAGGALAAEKTVTLSVPGMYCSSCPYIVKQSLAKVGGVGQVSASYETKTATVTYDDQKTTLAALIAATTRAGYPPQELAPASATPATKQ